MLDASLYISIASLLSSSSHVNQKLDDPTLKFIRKRFEGGEYVTLPNVLGLLLCCTPAIGISLEKIAHIIRELSIDNIDIEEGQDEDTILEFLESLQLVDVDLLIQQTASDLRSDICRQCQAIANGAFQVDGGSGSDKDELLFNFVQSKVWWLLKYLLATANFNSYFSLLEGYTPFENWLTGVYQPYVYYAQRAGETKPVTYIEYSGLDSKGKFDLFIQKLNLANSSEWLNRAILPLMEFNNNTAELLVEWLFLHETERHLNNSYKLWSEVLISLRGKPGHSELLDCYVGACYYYSIWNVDAQTLQLQNFKVQDSIKEVLSGSEDKTTEPVNSTVFSALLSASYPSFRSFMEDPSVRSLVGSPSLLLEMISVCEKLNSTVKLSIYDYVELKYKSNLLSRQKEAMKIMNGVNDKNWELVLESLNTFKSAFIDDSSENVSMVELVINRFLQANLFEVVDSLHQTGALPIQVNEYFQVLRGKFWEFFHLSTNLNDKIGKLHLAHEIVTLFNGISSSQELDKKFVSEIIQIKHLLKAISNMKNFKIVIERGVPVTPSQILSQYSSLQSESNSPMDLIALILEQNPKSYLAYEKLYRILNDLILGMPNSEAGNAVDGSIARLKSTCIEAALIDSNFQFAYAKSMELFEHYRSDNGDDGEKRAVISSTWLTFYQVGKYVAPSWYEDEGDKEGIARNKIDTQLKQREILSLLLKFNSSDNVSTSSDNSRLILTQLSKLNSDIEQFYELEVKLKGYGAAGLNVDRRSTETHKIGAIAGDIVNEATHTTHQASEKLSNLFVSGLGWAIGANLE